MILLFLFVLFANAVEAARTECGTDQVGSQQYGWCIDQPDVSLSHDILYLMHGAGGSEHSWQIESGHEKVLRAWRSMGTSAPSVITVSFGPRWLLTDVKRGADLPLYTLFVKKIMPRMEKRFTQLFGPVRGRRLLVGESMGGFSAAMLALKNGELFDRVVLTCPAILPISPFSSPAELNRFVDRHKDYINKEWFDLVVKWAHQEFPKSGDWRRNNPFRLVQNLTPRPPRFHISCGIHDEFGFFEGAEALAQMVHEKGAEVVWQALNGGHCVFDPDSIAQFLKP